VAVNDGAWHQAVATLGSDGMMLYLDGKRVASRTDTTNGQAYSGYWRLGGDRGWDNTSNFAGDIDEFSVYPSVLTPQQVNAHWRASGRPSAIAERPKDAYGATIYDANPDLYWRLSEEGGDVAADSSINGNSGTVLGARDQGGLGVIDGNASITLKRGNPGGNVVASRPTTNPVTFSQEFWLRTEAAGGGRILGFGNSANGTLSSNYDRHVYMLDDGRIRFGVWTGRAETVDSTSVLNDGQWHHVVSTFGAEGMRLFVDGQLEGSNPNTVAQNYTGYWKLGGDNTWGGNSETYYSGDLDEVAIYGRSMTEQEVQQHFTAGGGQLPNVDPVADFTWQGEGRTVTFDSSPSRDSDGSIESWSWDFGDGETSADAKPTHTYSKSGEFEVSLTVTDDRAGSDVVKSTVTIVNEAPVAGFSSAVEARTVTFTSTATDPDGSVQTHAWDFGDGATSEEENPVHTYAEAGSYTVTLVVIDDEGLQSEPVTRTVDTAAPNVAPTAAFTAAKDGLSVSFDSSGSSDPDGTVEAYVWDFGDGQTSSQAAPSHTYAQPGTYEVSLVVIDDDEAASEPAVRSVEVSEPVSGVVAADEFSRSVTTGWGVADTGGPWQTSGTAAYSVGDGAGQMAVRPGTATALLSQTSTDSVRVDAEFSVDKLLEAGYVTVIGRQIGSDRYYVRCGSPPTGRCVCRACATGPRWVRSTSRTSRCFPATGIG
jgi:trimeric autotransporter adhesin